MEEPVIAESRKSWKCGVWALVFWTAGAGELELLLESYKFIKIECWWRGRASW